MNDTTIHDTPSETLAALHQRELAAYENVRTNKIGARIVMSALMVLIPLLLAIQIFGEYPSFLGWVVFGFLCAGFCLCWDLQCRAVRPWFAVLRQRHEEFQKFFPEDDE